jgi:hypothetical protein
MTSPTFEPIRYTTREGGNWLPWTKGLVNCDRLRTTTSVYEAVVVVNAVIIHALDFGDGAVWDAINGWRYGKRP